MPAIFFTPEPVDADVVLGTAGAPGAAPEPKAAVPGPGRAGLLMPCAVAAAALGLSLGLVPAAQAQTAARDAPSSSLRVPTAEEAAALAARPNAKTAAKGLLTGKANPQPVRYADGTVGVELDDSTLLSSVARRNPDGSVSRDCVPAAEAQRIVNGTQAMPKPAKEHRHDLSK